MAKLQFTMVSPEKELFSRDVDQVDVPGSEGYLGVLAGHAPFMTAIDSGTVTVYDNGKTETIDIEGGFADITPEGLTILAEKAVM